MSDQPAAAAASAAPTRQQRDYTRAGHQQSRGAANPDADNHVPPEVLKFLKELNDAMKEKNMPLATTLYENRFAALTQQFYSGSKFGKAASEKRQHWPKLHLVKSCFSSPFVEQLYSSAHYRSVVNVLGTGLPAYMRTQAWESFQHVTNSVLAPTFNIGVPGGWLFDIVDEFVYQLQSFGYRRLKLGTAKEKEETPVPPHVGNPADAAAALEHVVAKSNIKILLAAVQRGEAAPTSVLDASINPETLAQRSLGLFALIGIVRLRTQLGDYRGAIEAAEVLGVYTYAAQITSRVPPALSCLFFYSGFAHLMLRRYEDASTLFMPSLSVKAGGRKFLEQQQFHALSLLVLCEVLGGLPKQFDLTEFVSGDRNRNRMIIEEDIALLAQGDLERFRQVFNRAAPKPIAPVSSPTGVRPQVYAANGHTYENAGSEAKELQTTVFMREVSQQVESLKLRELLQVYSTVTLDKLSTLLSKNTDDVVAMLLAAKRKNLQLTRRANDAKAVLRTASEIDFTAKGGSVAVQRRTAVTATMVRFVDCIQALSDAK